MIQITLEHGVYIATMNGGQLDYSADLEYLLRTLTRMAEELDLEFKN